jgi:hypothetical protein
MERFATTLFCDDVRQEVGNKVSLMGCYGHELFVEKFPIALPKLCGHVRVVTPIERPFLTVRFKAFVGEDLLPQTIDVPKSLLDKLFAEMPRNLDATMLQVGAILSFVPFFAPGPTSLRIMAETEEGELLAGRLWIKTLESKVADAPAQNTEPSLAG